MFVPRLSAVTVFLISACYSLTGNAADGVPFTRLVAAPTAGSLPSRNYSLETKLFNGGGLTQRITFGLHDLIDIGVSYGGSNIIGSTRIDWQPHASPFIQIRIVEETLSSPALAVGFDSQGEEPYIIGSKLNRFRIKSRGAYVVVSRNYRMLGNLGFHGGVNYSLETDDGDRDPSFWAGINKSVWESIEICCEYDFATNDNDQGDFTVDNGFLNAAVKWSFGSAFTLEFDLGNILRSETIDSTGSRIRNPEPCREIRFLYRGNF